MTYSTNGEGADPLPRPRLWPLPRLPRVAATGDAPPSSLLALRAPRLPRPPLERRPLPRPLPTDGAISSKSGSSRYMLDEYSLVGRLKACEPAAGLCAVRLLPAVRFVAVP